MPGPITHLPPAKLFPEADFMHAETALTHKATASLPVAAY